MHTEWTPNSEPLPGYRLIERLGQGGFAEVWKASAPGGILKAIKLVYGNMAPEGGTAPGHAAQELKSLSRVREVRNPFVLSVERVEILDGQLVVVTELADRNLSDRLKECQRQGMVGINRGELLQYLREAAEALDLMGIQYQLLHLDIKPDNLLLVGNHLKVGDFGLVKDLQGTSASVTYGLTPMYAAPETFDGRAYRSSDQYSLAIVYQEMLTGTRPFPGRSPREVLLQHLTSEPNLQPLPEADRAIVAKALSKDPKQRHGTCGEFIEALVRAAPAETLSLSAISTQTNSWLANLRNASGPEVRAEPLEGEEAATLQRPNLGPVLVVGVGGIGIECIGRMHNLLDQTQRHRAPVQFLGIDCDLGVLPHAQRLGLEERDVLVCPLQKPAYYLERWEHLKQRFYWMDANGLFKIGRSGGPEGHRALGRLALVDNDGLILERLAQVLDQLEQTGAGTPRIYLVGALGGGTASGMLIDLCYLIRRKLGSAACSRIVGVLFSGVDTSQPQQNLHRINHVAVLRDLAELSQPGGSYQPPAGEEGTIEPVPGPPLDAAYLFDTGPRALEPASRDSVVTSMARFVADHATSELGAKLEASGQRHEWPALRSLGVFSVTYPRRLLVRQASGRLARSMLSCWLEPVGDQESEVHGEHAVATFGGAANPDALETRLGEEAARHLGESLETLVRRPIEPLHQELAGAEAADQIERTRRVMDELDRLLGCDPAEQRSVLPEESRLERGLRSATCALVEQLSAPLFQVVERAMDQPGRKFGKGRSAADGLVRHLAALRDQHQPAILKSAQRTRQIAAAIRERLVDLSLADSHASVAPQTITEMLEGYANAKIRTRLALHAVLVYGGLIGALTRRLEDIDLGSRRLTRLLKALPELAALPAEGALGGTWAQALFPGGTVNAADPAGDVGEFASQADDFEQYLLEGAFQPRGGLWAVLDLRNRFDVELAKEIERCTSDWVARNLSASDAAGCLLTRYVANERGLLRELRAMHDAADPLASRPLRRPFDAAPAPAEGLFVTAPASKSGIRFLELAKQALPEVSLEPVVGPDHCSIYRAAATPGDGLGGWLSEAQSAYADACRERLAPNVLAHSRRSGGETANPPEQAPEPAHATDQDGGAAPEPEVEVSHSQEHAADAGMPASHSPAEAPCESALTPA